MGATENLTYENFIRFAFEKATNQSVDRWGDPAMLANTDVFDTNQLYKIKSGISYSMCILNSIIYEENSDQLSDALFNRMESIVDDVLNAQDRMVVYSLIVEYQGKFLPILNN